MQRRMSRLIMIMAILLALLGIIWVFKIHKPTQQFHKILKQDGFRILSQRPHITEKFLLTTSMIPPSGSSTLHDVFCNKDNTVIYVSKITTESNNIRVTIKFAYRLNNESNTILTPIEIENIKDKNPSFHKVSWGPTFNQKDSNKTININVGTGTAAKLLTFTMSKTEIHKFAPILVSINNLNLIRYHRA